MANLILALNPGSTSTKIGLYEGFKEVFSESIEYQVNDLEVFKKIIEQLDLRLKHVLSFLGSKGVKLNQLKAVVGRGGLLKPIPGGTYLVNEIMLKDLKEAKRGEHASNLGAFLAKAIGEKASCPAYIVDPVVVDELEDVARLSGLPELEKRSIFHALNHKAVARKYAGKIGKKYEELSLIVAHLGGGISVGLHHQGRVIEVNDALSGAGPFSPNRTGALPTLQLVEMCFSGKYTKEELLSKILKKGGLAAYLNTTDLRQVEQMIEEGNEKAQLVFKAMAYQTAREIGSLAPVVQGKLDAIILTGGMAHSSRFTAEIKKMVTYLAKVEIYPGEEELAALAAGAYRVLRGEEKPRIYQ